MTFLSIDRDINGVPSYGLEFSDNNQMVTLTQNIEQTLVVDGPYTEFEVMIQYQQGTDVLVAMGNDSIVGPTGSFAATPAQLNPPLRFAMFGDTLRFFCLSTAAVIVVSFYGLS